MEAREKNMSAVAGMLEDEMADMSNQISKTIKMAGDFAHQLAILKDRKDILLEGFEVMVEAEDMDLDFDEFMKWAGMAVDMYWFNHFMSLNLESEWEY